MRTIVVKNSLDLQALRNDLLVSGLGAANSAAALEMLQALNAHVDLNKLAAGAVLLVPDTTHFKRASPSIAGEALNDFQKLMENALEATAARLKQGQDMRASDRVDLAAALKSGPVKRALDADSELKAQADNATKQIEQDEQNDVNAEKTLQAAMKGVRAELAALAKLVD